MTSTHSNLAFVGTYTEGDSISDGIYSYRVRSATGALERVAVTASAQNPTFLTIHPDGTYLYTADQVRQGTITAYEINRATGELDIRNRVSSGGDRPCHVTVDATGSYLLAAHYSGECVSMLPIGEDGRVGKPTDIVTHSGSSVDPERQTKPRPHSVNIGPGNRFAYVPDLGTDRVNIYRIDKEEGKLRLGRTPHVDLHDGAGPRHFAIDPSGQRAFLINELDSTLTVFERDIETGSLSTTVTLPTIPPEYAGENAPADVHVHPSGNWVYASNRGHDSIAFYERISSDTIRLRGTQPTLGRGPRNFAIGPDGTFLFAENRHSNSIVSFRVDPNTGELSPTGSVANTPQPACMKILSASDA